MCFLNLPAPVTKHSYEKELRRKRFICLMLISKPKSTTGGCQAQDEPDTMKASLASSQTHGQLIFLPHSGPPCQEWHFPQWAGLSQVNQQQDSSLQTWLQAYLFQAVPSMELLPHSSPEYLTLTAKATLENRETV